MDNKAIIETGDYIASDFCGWMIQGTVTRMGLLGKIPAYLIETFTGRTEAIIKGQAVLYWKPGEREAGYSRRGEHD